MKKLLTAAMILLLTIATGAPLQAQTDTPEHPTSGTTGPLTWKFDWNTGTLTIAGRGEMPDYSGDEPAPWAYYGPIITNITLYDGITAIGRSAFGGAAISAITIPASVRQIGIAAFNNCNALRTVKIHAGITDIGFAAFSMGCDALTNIDVDPANPTYSSLDGVLLNKARTLLIQYPAGRADSAYTIPEGVTEIENGTFYRSILQAVTLPADVKKIGAQAFLRCNKLKNFTVNHETPLKVDENIFPKSFYDIILTVPAGKKSAYAAAPVWKDFKQITEAPGATEGQVGTLNWTYDVPTTTLTFSGRGTLPADSAKQPMPWAIYRETVTKVIIEKGITDLAASAFMNYANLQSVSLPDSLTRLGANAFRSTGLTSLVIPAGIDTIPGGLCQTCVNLTSVTLPPSVKEIGAFAFYACLGLKQLKAEMPIPPVLDKKDIFAGVPFSSVTLTVPKGAKAAYAAAPVWKEFKQIAESTVSNALLPKARIYTADGRLYLTLARAETVHIYNVSGALVRTFNAPAGETSLALPQGVYVVRAGERTEKVIVE